jgi:hypothetical protein
MGLQFVPALWGEMVHERCDRFAADAGRSPATNWWLVLGCMRFLPAPSDDLCWVWQFLSNKCASCLPVGRRGGSEAFSGSKGCTLTAEVWGSAAFGSPLPRLR